MLSAAKARGSRLSASGVAFGDHAADALDPGRGEGHRVEPAEERRELHAERVDLGERLDVDVGDDGADAVLGGDQALGLEAGEDACGAACG